MQRTIAQLGSRVLQVICQRWLQLTGRFRRRLLSWSVGPISMEHESAALLHRFVDSGHSGFVGSALGDGLRESVDSYACSGDHRAACTKGPGACRSQRAFTAVSYFFTQQGGPLPWAALPWWSLLRASVSRSRAQFLLGCSQATFFCSFV